MNISDFYVRYFGRVFDLDLISIFTLGIILLESVLLMFL